MAVKQFTMHEDLSAPLAGTGPFPSFPDQESPFKRIRCKQKGPRKIDRGRNPFNFLNHLQEERFAHFHPKKASGKEILYHPSFSAGSKRRSAKKVLASLHCLSNKASCMRAHVFIAAFVQETLPLHIHQRAQGIFLIEKISL